MYAQTRLSETWRMGALREVSLWSEHRIYLSIRGVLFVYFTALRDYKRRFHKKKKRRQVCSKAHVLNTFSFQCFQNDIAHKWVAQMYIYILIFVQDAARNWFANFWIFFVFIFHRCISLISKARNESKYWSSFFSVRKNSGHILKLYLNFCFFSLTLTQMRFFEWIRLFMVL